MANTTRERMDWIVDSADFLNQVADGATSELVDEMTRFVRPLIRALESDPELKGDGSIILKVRLGG